MVNTIKYEDQLMHSLKYTPMHRTVLTRMAIANKTCVSGKKLRAEDM